MKIAIDNNKSFSDLWIKYCETENIDFKLVNCYDNTIIQQLADCDVLMWHHHHANYKDILFAKQLLYSLEQSGKTVFPNFNTTWHFDDKVGQKYLLEAIGAPLVKSYVFYSKSEALDFVNSTSFPKVFKLRGGAGSANVKLIQSAGQARGLVNQAFGRGFPVFDRIGYFKERFNKFLNGKDTLLGVMKGLGRLIIPVKDIKMIHREKGYVYFQDFIPNNNSDTRIIIIGDKAFAIKRMVRKNDFRASGSGSIVYSKDEIDIRCVKTAFETSAKLQSQCMAYDFVFDQENAPLIVEMSYGFSPAGYVDCPGYWGEDLTWHEGEFNPYGWMVDLVIDKVKNKHT
jgi:glutathione synthase/RimK-type ligase-like ATP-grasp enzyme